MPNPIPQDARVSKWRSSVDAIDHCPKLAAQICKIFAGWADLERRLDYLFLEVSGGSSRAGIAVFDAIDSRRLRAQVVTFAAEASLRDTNQMAVRAVLKLISSASKNRDKLAHNTTERNA